MQILPIVKPGLQETKLRDADTRKEVAQHANELWQANVPWRAEKKTELVGGFNHLLFSTLFGEDSQFDYMICFKWVDQTETKEKR